MSFRFLDKLLFILGLIYFLKYLKIRNGLPIQVFSYILITNKIDKYTYVK